MDKASTADQPHESLRHVNIRSAYFFKGGPCRGLPRATILSIFTFLAAYGSIQLAFNCLAYINSPNFTGLGPSYFFPRADVMGVGNSDDWQLQRLLLKLKALAEAPTADKSGGGGNGEVNGQYVQANATEHRQEREWASQQQQQKFGVGEPPKVLGVRGPEQAPVLREHEKAGDVREEAKGGVQQVLQVTGQEHAVEVREGEKAVEARNPKEVNIPWHTWSDKKLIRKALSVEGASDGPFKVAFLFMSYEDIPLAPFWERYFQGHEEFYSVYVHVSTPGFQLDPSRKGFYGRQIRSEQVSRWKSSMVDAERRLLANALLDPLNLRFILLSESCIPVRSFQGLYRFLVSKNYAKSNIEIYRRHSADGRVVTGGRWREDLLPSVTKKMFRKGSQWFEMHRRHARVVVGDNVYWGPLKEKWKVPDEHYIPTLFRILGMQNEISRTSLTHVNWSENHQGHPRSYSLEDVQPSLFMYLQSLSPTKFFARKFETETLPALLNLPTTLLGF